MGGECWNFSNDDSSEGIGKTDIASRECKLDVIRGEFKDFNAYFIHDVVNQSNYYYKLPLSNKEYSDSFVSNWR